MANTISELEAERAKILEEIASKAKSISDPGKSEHTLQDWLKAASEVVPESAFEAEAKTAKTGDKPQGSSSGFNQDSFNDEPPSSAQMASKRLNTDPYMRASDEFNSSVTDPAPDDELESVKLSLHSTGPAQNSQQSTNEFNEKPHDSGMNSPRSPKSGGGKTSSRPMVAGVAISLTLLLTTLGVMVVGYNSIHSELLTVTENNEKNRAKIEDLQKQLKQLPLSAEASLISASENQQKIRSLQNQLVTLEAQLSQVRSQLDEYQKSGRASLAEEEMKGAEQGITERLDQLVQKLQKMESAKNQTESKPFVKPFHTPVKVAVDNKQVNAPVAPVEPTVSEPKAEQQLISLVQKQAPKEPEIKPVAGPKKNYTADVKWLLEQPGQHYILQLASMKDEKSLQRMVDNQQIENAKIIPQVRDGKTGYVLVTGSFADRKEAKQLSGQIKRDLGISPWMRKVADLSGRVE